MFSPTLSRFSFNSISESVEQKQNKTIAESVAGPGREEDAIDFNNGHHRWTLDQICS